MHPTSPQTTNNRQLWPIKNESTRGEFGRSKYRGETWPQVVYQKFPLSTDYHEFVSSFVKHFELFFPPRASCRCLEYFQRSYFFLKFKISLRFYDPKKIPNEVCYAKFASQHRIHDVTFSAPPSGSSMVGSRTLTKFSNAATQTVSLNSQNLFF